MRMSIIGLPNAGKTTFFQILTHHGQEGSLSGKKGSRIGTVFVPDNRLDQLSAVYKPKKQVNASMEFIDTKALSIEGSGKCFSSEALEDVRVADTLCLVIQDFDSPSAPNLHGSIDGKRDLEFILSEFLFADLISLEKRAQKLIKTTRMTKKADELRELDVVEKAIKLLEDEVPIRDAEFTENEIKLLSSFQLLSAKKLLIVLNIDEDGIDGMNNRVDAYSSDYPGITVTAICASLEFELSQMSEEDAQLFMADMNLPGFASERIIKACYTMLGLNVFFTVGPDECRAWPIKKGSTAYEAAGKIHTDIQRGFIRAVVLSFESFAKEPAESAFKSRSAQEKKDYIMADGDIVEFRFNVSK